MGSQALARAWTAVSALIPPHLRPPSPQAAMLEFVQQLKQEGVFAKEVRTGGMAFHSYFMDAIAPTLLQQLKKVGGCPRAARQGPP